VRKVGVKVKLKKTATVDAVRKHKADAVILATGSKFRMQPVPGVDHAHVINTVDLYQGTRPIGERVPVVAADRAAARRRATWRSRGRRSRSSR
jgi:pyruvate/2-oxoglutarate dehydrogenase complex dihydrolipoamide dehydrogenase (E3) component